MRGFRKLVRSYSAKCGSWRVQSASDLFCLKHPIQIPFTQFERSPKTLSAQRLPDVLEEAVWMLGVVVGLAG